jgi:hypothetical protein
MNTLQITTPHHKSKKKARFEDFVEEKDPQAADDFDFGDLEEELLREAGDQRTRDPPMPDGLPIIQPSRESMFKEAIDYYSEELFHSSLLQPNWAEKLDAVLRDVWKKFEFCLDPETAIEANNSLASSLPLCKVRDGFGCICTDQLPRTFGGHLILNNRVTSSGVGVYNHIDPHNPKYKVDPEDIKDNPLLQIQRHRKEARACVIDQLRSQRDPPFFHRMLQRELLALDAGSSATPRRAQSGPVEVKTGAPAPSSSRVFCRHRVTQSGVLTAEGGVASMASVFYHLARTTGLVAELIWSTCTNQQKTGSTGFMLSEQKLSWVYSGSTYCPTKIEQYVQCKIGTRN